MYSSAASTVHERAVHGPCGLTERNKGARRMIAGHDETNLTGSPERANPFGGAVKAYAFDFANPERMAEALAGVEVLYNTYWVRFNRKKPRLAQPDHEEAARNSSAIFEAARLAGVRKVVHVSIAHADENSPLAYYRGKGAVDAALRNSGLEHSIVRPAMLFGPGAVLVNNLAWTLRRLPVCVVFGNGRYRVRPTFVDDVAAVLVAEGGKSGNSDLYALGPEELSYRDFMKEIAGAVGVRRPVIGMPVWLAYPGVWLLGKMLGEPLTTPEEIAALTGGLLSADVGADSPSGSANAGGEPGSTNTPGLADPALTSTSLTAWMRQNADSLGKSYISEGGRRKDKRKAY